MNGNKRIILLVSILLMLSNGLMAQLNQTSPWPMFRHDAKHTGASPYTGPGTPTLYWTYQTNDGVASSPSIGADGTIYVGSGWYFLRQTDSSLYALNPDGTLKWKYTTLGGIFASPAIDEDGTIYFGTIYGYMYALEDSVTYAKMRWQLPSGFKVFSSPVIDDNGTVYMGSLDFQLFAIDPAGSINWSDSTDWCIFGSPGIDDNGNIFVGSKDHYLYLYDDLGDTYTREWAHPFGEFFDGHLVDATVAQGPDGTFYVGTDQFGGSGLDPVPIDTSFFAVNPDGTRKWAFYVGHGVESSPAIGKDGMVYFGSYDSTFYAIKDMGNYAELVWQYKTGGVIDASPTIGGDGTIYIGSRDSTLYAFNPDGTIQWTFNAGGEIESSVTINGDGIIYFGGMDGKIYALGSVNPDIGPVEWNTPYFINPDSTVNPTASIHNYRTEQSSVTAELLIDTNGVIIYGDTVNLAVIDAGATAQIVFEPWMVGSVANISYDMNLATILGGDNNYVNDTLFDFASTANAFICGDPNISGNINILDITFLISYLYKGGMEPVVPQSADVNNSGGINILDITRLIAYLYKDGPDPDCGLP